MDSAQKQIETLRADLQAERSNFSNVSKVLNQQRRLSSTTKNQQNQVIKVRINQETSVKYCQYNVLTVTYIFKSGYGKN